MLPIEIPPLRSRREDIPSLTHHFLKIHSEEQGVKLKDITSEALDILVRHDWPGNIRELRNQVERFDDYGSEKNTIEGRRRLAVYAARI